MANPSLADFHFAMVAADRHGILFRLQLQDAEYKKGHVEKWKNKTNAGIEELPFAMPGGFAIVYKFVTQSGRTIAFRVFQREVEADMQYRYERIEPYFRSKVPEITADFKYFKSGIKVGDSSNVGIFDVIIMEWVEGQTLIQAVDKLCQKRDRQALTEIANNWAQVVRALNGAHMAHGDLSGNNIMVRHDRRLVLVDYDGVFIPEFAGRPAVVGGTQDYLHPDSSKRKFNERLDDFSALAIHTSLAALSVKPELWDTSGIKRAPNGQPTTDHLLFRFTDFQNPAQSALFKQLFAIGNQNVQDLARELEKASKLPVDQIRLPSILIDPDLDKKEALKILDQAIAKNKDREIAAAWTPILHTYPPAQKHRTRAEQAVQHISAVDIFLKALVTDDDEQIYNSYTPVLDTSSELNQSQRDRLATARKRWPPYKEFSAALKNGDEQSLVKVYTHAQILASHPKVTKTDKDRVDLARKCINMRDQVRAALAKQDEEGAATAYDKALVRSWSFLSVELPLIQQAVTRAEIVGELVRAVDTADDARVKQLYEANQVWLGTRKGLDKKQKRIAEAIQREDALQEFRRAVYQGKDDQVIQAASRLPRGYARFTSDDQKALALAQARTELRKAIQADDDLAIVDTASNYEKVAPPFYQLTPQEKSRIENARQNMAALQELADALAKNDDALIQNVYQARRAFFAKAPQLSQANRDRVKLAEERLAALEKLWDAIKRGDDKEIVALAAKPPLDRYPKFMPLDVQKIEKARAREKLRAALTTNDDARIFAAYDDKILPQFEGLTPEEMARVKRAIQQHTDWEALIKALQTDDDEVIARNFKSGLEQYGALTEAQMKRIQLARQNSDTFRALRDAMDRKDDERIVELANQLPKDYPKLAAIEKRRIENARTLLSELKAYREALDKHDDELVASRFTPGLQTYSKLTPHEKTAPDQARQRIEHYRELTTAFAKQDDDRIEKYAHLLPADYYKLSAQQLERIKQASARVEAATEFRRALNSYQLKHADERAVVTAFDPILEQYSGLLQAERDILKQCQAVLDFPSRVRAALATDDDNKIKDSFVADQLRPWHNFSPPELKRIELAQKRLGALLELRKAIQTENDDQIASRYVEILKNYPALTPVEISRIETAGKRSAVLKKLREAISTGDERNIVNAFDPIIEPSISFTPAEREIVENAKRVVQMPTEVRRAIQGDDDRAIVAAFDSALTRTFTDLNAQEMERIRLAQAYVRFLDVLSTQDDEKICANYDSILDTFPKITAAQRQELTQARKRWEAWLKFRDALDYGDELQLFEAYDPMLANYPRITPEMWERYQRAKKCVTMRRDIQDAIASQDDRRITDAFDPTLVRDFNRPDKEQQARIELATQRVALLDKLDRAIAKHDDVEILEAAKPILAESINYSSAQRQQVAGARERDAALEKFLDAVKSDNDEQIIDAYSSHQLNNYGRVPPSARERLDFAKKRAAALTAFETAVWTDNDEEILQTYYRERVYLDSIRDLDTKLVERRGLAKLRTDALLKFRKAINSKDEWRILRDYDAGLLDNYAALKHWDKSQLERARQVVEMYQRLERALAQDDDEAIVAAFDTQKVSQAKPLTQAQLTRIQAAQHQVETTRQVQQALRHGSVARAIQIEQASKILVQLPEFVSAKHDFVSLLDAQNVSGKIRAQELALEWDWNPTPMVNHVLVTWHPDAFVEHPDLRIPQSRIVERSAGQMRGALTVPIGTHWRYFVRIFSALPIYTRGTANNYVFSQAREPTCSAIVRRPVRVVWELKKRKGSAQNELELRTYDNTPLPQLIIVRQQHHLPMRKDDGAFVAQVPDAIAAATNPTKVVVPLEVSKWARHTILRIFPADDALASIVSIDGGTKGLKVEVN